MSLLTNNVFASPGNSYWAASSGGGGGGGGANTWYQFPTQNAEILFDVSGYPQQTLKAIANPIDPAITDLEWDNHSVLPYSWYNYATLSGNIAFIDASGNHNLQSIGGDLFYDGSLLAKAGDIQDIAAWSDYPMIHPLVGNGFSITGINDISGSGTFSSNVVDANDVIASSISAAADVNCNFLNVFNPLLGLGVDPLTETTIFEGDITTGGDISGATLHISSTATINNIDLSGCALTSNAGGTALFVNGVEVQTGTPSDASQWSTFKAVSAVNMDTNTIGNCPRIESYSVASPAADITIQCGNFAQSKLFVNGATKITGSLETTGLITQDIVVGAISTNKFSNPVTIGDSVGIPPLDVTTGGLTVNGPTVLDGGTIHGCTIGSLPVLGVNTVRVDVLPIGIDILSPTFVTVDAVGAVNLSAGLVNQVSAGTYVSLQAASGTSTNSGVVVEAPFTSSCNLWFPYGGNIYGANDVSSGTMHTGSLTASGAVSGGSGTFGPLYTSDTKIHLGFTAGSVGQQANSIAIGNAAGFTDQSDNAVAVGPNAGSTNQGARATAVGVGAGFSDQGTGSVALGRSAGNSFLGTDSVAIGNSASIVGGSFANTIVINATGAALNPPAASSTCIAPLRNVSTQPAATAFAMGYTSATGELTVANTKINEIEDTVNNTQQISYDTGLLTTTINGITSLQTVNTSGPVSIGNPVIPANLTVSGNITLTDASGNVATQVVAQPSYVYYVAKNGRVGATGAITDPLSSINEALSKAANISAVDAPGMTIYVGVGSYTEDVAINIAPATLPAVSIIGMGDDTDDSKRVQIRGAMTISGSNVTLVNTVNTVVLNNLSVFAKDAVSSAITMTGRGYRVYLKNGLYTTPFTATAPLISLASTGPTSNSVVQLVIDNCSMSVTGGAGHIISMTSGQLFEIQNTDMTHRGTGLAVNMSGGAFSVANQSAFGTTGAVFNIVQSAAGLTNVTSCVVSGRASPTVALITLGTNANLNLSESTVQNLNTTEANNTSRYIYTTSATGNFIAAIRNNITNSASPATVQQISPWQAAVAPASQLLYFGNIYTNQTATLVGVLPAQGGAGFNAVRQFNTDTYTQQLQVVATSASAIVLTPTARGKTFILTGTTTQAFSTTGFGLADAGFFVIVHNGNASGGGDINMTGMTGTAIIHNRTGSQNGGDVYLFWNGTGLVGY